MRQRTLQQGGGAGGMRQLRTTGKREEARGRRWGQFGPELVQNGIFPRVGKL